MAEQAYLLIRDKILRGNLPLGAPLSRRKIAQECGMSFQPVSEAIQQLERDGVVESLPRAGTRVKVPTENEVREHFILREALESQAARLCNERATFWERLELRRAADHLDSMLPAITKEEPNAASLVSSFVTQHFSFHMKIAEYGRCPALFRALEKNQVLTFIWLHGVLAERIHTHGSHRTLADVIAQGTLVKADQAMRGHVCCGLEDMVASLSARASAGEWRVDSTVVAARKSRGEANGRGLPANGRAASGIGIAVVGGEE